MDGFVIYLFIYSVFQICYLIWRALHFQEAKFSSYSRDPLRKEMGENVSELWCKLPIPFLILVFISNHF